MYIYTGMTMHSTYYVMYMYLVHERQCVPCTEVCMYVYSVTGYVYVPCKGINKLSMEPLTTLYD